MVTASFRIEDLDDEEFMEKSQRKCSFYAEKWLDIIPYYYQIPFLDDPYRFKAATFSRQLGKTFSIALKASHVINMFPGSEVGIIAHNERRAFEIYRMVKDFQYRNPMLKSMLQPKNDKMHEMILDNSSLVTYYASGTEGKSIRGATLDLLLMDEADFVPDLVYMATIPTVSATGGSIMMTSTPNKPYSMFYNIFMDGWEARLKYEGKKELEVVNGQMEEPYTAPIGREYKFVSYHYDWKHGTKVRNPDTGLLQIDPDVVNILRVNDFYEYEREYMAWWSEEGSTFFPAKAIRNAIVKNSVRLKPPVQYIMGLDLGRINDYTAIVIYEVNEARDNAIIIKSDRIRRNDWKVIFNKILQYVRKYRVSEIYLDGNNVGDIMYSWLASVAGEADFAVEAIPMSIQSKAHLYNNLKMGINTGRIRIHESCENLVQELIQLQAEETDTGKVKIHHPPGKYDDEADGAALGAKPLAFPELVGSTTFEYVNHREFHENITIGPDEDISDIIADSDFTVDDWDLEPSFEF